MPTFELETAKAQRVALLVAAATLVALAACKAGPGADDGSSSHVLVNFSEEGNRQLKLMYDGLGNDCGSPSGKRILISYFGPFMGSTTGNASERLAALAMARPAGNGGGTATSTGATEAIVETPPPNGGSTDDIADPAITPTGTDTQRGEGYALTGETAAPPPPATTKAGTMVVDGVTYPVCWVRGEVTLRFPAALHKIVKDFRPDVVVSMGEAPYTRLETSALNRIDPGEAYYDADGNEITDPNQQNTSNRVIENGDATASTPVPVEQVDFTWDAATLSKKTGATAGVVDEENTYVCNATATVIGYAIKAQRPFTYAPGLDLSPLPGTIKHGFLHVDETGKAEDALKILEEVVRTSLKR
jgi:pyrrolidone-carboxylate peptidase